MPLCLPNKKIATPARVSPVNNRLVICVKLFLLLTLLNFGGRQAMAQTGHWTPLTNAAPHYNEGEMLLLTDGTVIAKTSAGGRESYGVQWDKLTPDSHGSYVNGTWSAIAPMDSSRLYFSSQVLADGRVYVAGGEYGGGGKESQVYDPVANTWSAPVAPSLYVISDANSELLPNGKVLQALVDGYGTTHNYLWDPATNTYATGASCLRIDNEAVWVKLPDNSILFADNYGKTTERYIPATNRWINDATMPVNLYDRYGKEAGAAFLLPDGRVFFIGSTSVTAYYTPSGTTDPGTWVAGPAIPDSMGAPDASAAMMVNGKMLMAMSKTPTDTGAAAIFPKPTTFYEFDYTTNIFTRIQAPGAPAGVDTLHIAAYTTNLLDLPDGTVLYGQFGDDQYYTYTPGSSPLAAGKPAISGIMPVSCDTFMATGTLFNGITEGAAYGDDWQMSTNYPIVRLTGAGNVYYARSFHWNRIGAVMTGALPDTTLFSTAGIPDGVYSIEVIANGNASDTGVIHIGTQAIYTASNHNVHPDSAVTLMLAYPRDSGNSYNWNFDGGKASPGTGPETQVVSWPTPGIKYVRLTVTSGNCSTSYTDSIIVGTPAGMANNIIISPNPNRGTFDIQFGEVISSPFNVRLTDMQGRVAYNNRFGANGSNKVSIATSGLPDAVYMVTINISGIVVHRKVVINR